MKEAILAQHGLIPGIYYGYCWFGLPLQFGFLEPFREKVLSP